MSSLAKLNDQWGSSYRLVASEKWKAKSAEMGSHVTEAIVDYADPRPGMKVLDLASGTGEPAITVASRVGPHGHVTAMDLSSELLEIAEQRARDRGLTNVTTRVADANELPFPDNHFDLVTSRFGVMFFQQRALEEARRVLKPGGRACFLAWGPFGQPYWESMFGVAHKFVGGPLLTPDVPNPFKFAESGSLTSALRAAGFSDVDEELRTVPWTWPGPPEEVWEQARAVSVPFRPMLERIPAEQQTAVDGAVCQAIRKYVRGGRIEFGATIILASGRKA